MTSIFMAAPAALTHAAAALPIWLTCILVTVIVLTHVAVWAIRSAGPELRRWVEMRWAHEAALAGHRGRDDTEPLPSRRRPTTPLDRTAG